MKVFYLVLILTAFICTSCNTSVNYIEAEGTITYVGLEGGFWGIIVDDGRKFDPVNLPERFEKEGLRVHAKMRPRDELAGTHMWGQMVEVVDIEVVDDRY